MSRVCFIGNIPYDLTEEQIVEIFSEVGNVQNFRLVFDRETGKPKGREDDAVCLERIALYDYIF